MIKTLLESHFSLYSLVIFIVSIIILVIIDWWFFIKGGDGKNIKLSLKSTFLWFIAAMTMGIFLWFTAEDKNHSTDFLVCYFIELSLSIDNIFVFIVIFKSLKIRSTRRILNIGILGAIVMRFFVIILALELIKKFEWIFYIFGIILLLTGIKMFSEQDDDSRRTPWYMHYFTRVSNSKFFTKQNNPTINLLALILILQADIIFAVDSIPAIISITKDPFIVFTSNIFAISGLFSLYTLLSHFEKKFIYLKYGIAVILLFIGIKLILVPQHIVIGKLMSFIIILLSISLSIIFSIYKGEKVK